MNQGAGLDFMVHVVGILSLWGIAVQSSRFFWAFVRWRNDWLLAKTCGTTFERCKERIGAR